MRHWAKNSSPYSQARQAERCPKAGPRLHLWLYEGERGDLSTEQHSNFAAKLLSAGKVCNTL